MARWYNQISASNNHFSNQPTEWSHSHSNARPSRRSPAAIPLTN